MTQEIRYEGTLVSTGNPQWIDVPFGIDEFNIKNATNLAGGAGIVEARWDSTMANGTAITDTLAGGTITTTVITAAGFTYEDSSTVVDGALVASGTAITAATPAVVSDAAAVGTAPVVGDIVRMLNTTGMLQISGMEFSVTAATAGVSYTLGYLPAAGFAAAATNADFRIIHTDLLSYPRKRYITAITAANPAVITLSVTHGYSVGEKITIRNGMDRGAYRFGMPQIDGLTGTITAVNTTTNTITTDIDASAFTAFAFPTSAVAAAGVTHPHIVPAGEIATVLTGAFRNPETRRIYLGTAIDGTAADRFTWVAIRNAN